MSNRGTAMAFAGALVAFGCSTTVRFQDRPVVWDIEDRADIPEPAERAYNPKTYFARVFATDLLDRALSLPDREPAWNTNALEEVPNSTWFENRIGVRPLSPVEAARGPINSGPPRLPIRIVSSKVGGGNPGFIIADSADRKFLVKFDTPENPELQTAAGVIVGRIFWALGYHVPADHVFAFRRADLRIDPG
ncbi:MAG TPA: hypothetical protein VIM73_07650, partial [Polyangiaceae bacterium]